MRREEKVCWVWGILAVCLPLAVYLCTLCPTIWVGDSGELVAGAYCLGVVHPPGYPLYCLVGRMMAFLPVGDVALRLNLFSALCAALSAGLVFLLVMQVGRRSAPKKKEQRVHPAVQRMWTPALLAGLLCAFSRTLWSQAVVAEVYALHLFLLLLCLVLLVWWEERGERRFLLAFAFILGLNLAHHPTAALAVPAFLLFLFWHRGKFFENWRTPLVMVGLLILGLSVYLYLPLRSLANPPLDWGHPATMKDALAHITRASYGSLSKQPRSWSLLGDQIHAFLMLLKRQLGSSLLGLGLIGLIALFYKAKDWFVITIIFFIGYGLGIIGLLNFSVAPGDLYLVQVFFIPSYAMVAIWVGMGARWLADGILYLAAPIGPRGSRFLGKALGIVVPFLAIVPLWANFTANDRSAQFQAADVGRNILATLEPEALLFTSMDTPTFSLAHARLVEGLRPDVSLQHNSRADIFRHLPPSAEPLHPEDRPIYGITPSDLPKLPGWKPCQMGIVYQLRKAPAMTEERLRIWDRYSLRGIEGGRHGQDFFLRELIRNYATARGNLAQELARESRFELALRQARHALAMDSTFFGTHLSTGNVYFQMGEYERAIQAYERALNWAPENVEAMNNLALTKLKRGDVHSAIQLYERSIALQPGLAKTHNDLGLAYKEAGLYSQAAVAYQRAVQLNPDYADPLRNLGVLYAYHLVDFSRAIVLWERYLELNPEDAERDEIVAEIQRMRDLLGKGMAVGGEKQ